MLVASRYPTIKVSDYCFNPRHVVDGDKDILVPCGKCDGCLLHKANEWSMRVGQEIEATPGTIFFTLTYNNHYLPKLKCVGSQYNHEYSKKVLFWSSDNDLNVRFDGVKDKMRVEPFNDKVFSCFDEDYKSIQNFISSDGALYMPYSSKRDVQLWLKMLRKDLVENFNLIFDGKSGFTEKDRLFRYFIISEYGPTTFRPHLHGLIFPLSIEISSYLLECGLYKNWQMCDKVRFEQYTHLCDSGARGYVTQYLTRFSALPDIYKFNKEITPFRLSSKSPAIGFVEQENEKIYEDVSHGVIEYSRSIPRLGVAPVLKYPKDYLSRLFPKCERYKLSSLSRVSFVYGSLWKAVRGCGYRFDDVSSWFRAFVHPMNYQATMVCYRFCERFNNKLNSKCDLYVRYYLYLLDMYYYKRDMFALRLQYEEQQGILYKSFEERCNYLLVYSNVYDFICENHNKFGVDDYVVTCFLLGFGFQPFEFIIVKDYLRTHKRSQRDDYKREVSDILQDMEKVAKFNELTGNSPHIV